MHQTVREFFLDPDGEVAKSDFRICGNDAHSCISMTCIQYLKLCAGNTALAERLPDIRSWTSKHFEDSAQYLEGRPLATYALRYLKDHINRCDQGANTLEITSKFVDNLIDSPAAYLLKACIRQHLNKTPPSNEHVYAAQNFGNNTLHAAVRKCFPIAAEVLLTAGADVNTRDGEGWTPLSRAAERGHEAVVKLLLDTGKVDVDSKDSGYGRTPLWWAAGGGHEAVVKLLLETGKVDLDSKDKYNGQTPLSWAARGGHEAVVKLLLDGQGQRRLEG